MTDGPWQECHAIGCLVKVRPTRLMCSGHWRHVPKEMREKIASSRGVDREDAEMDAIEHVGEVDYRAV